MAILRASWWRTLWFILCLASAGVHSLAGAAELLVPAEYPTIQAAVDAALDGDTVLVSPGTYLENVSIAKSISVKSVSGPSDTVIDGQSNGSVVRIFAWRVHLVGFTVRAGAAEKGAGLYISAQQVTVKNCWIMDNRAQPDDEESGLGGGIFMQVGPIDILDNRISSNRANHGGGIFVNNVSSANASRIEGNTIEDNFGGLDSGGIKVLGSKLRVIGNIVRGNRTYNGGAGGGMTFTGSGGLVVANNLVVDNNADYVGGIIYHSAKAVEPNLWVNNTIVDNLGGAMSFWQEPTPHMLANNIIGTIDCRVNGLKFERNDVIGGVEKKCSQAKTGSNLSNVNPQFTLGPRGHYYHLAPDSPLVDAGSNRFVNEAGLERDLGRRHRIIDGGHDKKADIGAFEYRPGQ